MSQQVDLDRLSAIVRECEEDITFGFDAGSKEYGAPPEELVAMVADMSTEIGRGLAEEFGVSPKRFLVNIMAVQHWTTFFQEFAPAALPLMADPPKNSFALIFILPSAGGSQQIVFGFAERSTWRVTAPGGQA
jgi:hypothetical protein